METKCNYIPSADETPPTSSDWMISMGGSFDASGRVVGQEFTIDKNKARIRFKNETEETVTIVVERKEPG